MADPHGDARVALQVLRQALRAMKVSVGGNGAAENDDHLQAITDWVAQHQAMTEGAGQGAKGPSTGAPD